MNVVGGQLHDPVAGVTRPVVLSWDAGAGALRIDSGGMSARTVAASRLVLSAGGFQQQSVHLSWTDQGMAWAVTVTGTDSVASLSGVLPPELSATVRGLIDEGRVARNRGRRTLAVLVALLLLPVGGLVAAFVLREPIVSTILRRLPPTVDAQLGEVSFRAVASTRELLAPGPALESVRVLGGRLAAAGSPHPYRFRFEVIRDPSVNAFAAPGGLVVVHTGLLLAASSPDEVAGVLAHEVAHVLERHSLRQMIFQAGLGTAGRLLIGAPEGAAEVLTGSALNLTALRFGREQEIAADQGGLELLRKAGLPGEGLSGFFDRLATKEGALPPLLSSHPPARDRAARLEAARSRLGTWPVENLGIDWPAVQADARTSR